VCKIHLKAVVAQAAPELLANSISTSVSSSTTRMRRIGHCDNGRIAPGRPRLPIFCDHLSRQYRCNCEFGFWRLHTPMIEKSKVPSKIAGRFEVSSGEKVLIYTNPLIE
jgi:hypothetical protein